MRQKGITLGGGLVPWALQGEAEGSASKQRNNLQFPLLLILVPVHSLPEGLAYLYFRVLSGGGGTYD